MFNIRKTETIVEKYFEGFFFLLIFFHAFVNINVFHNDKIPYETEKKYIYFFWKGGDQHNNGDNHKHRNM